MEEDDEDELVVMLKVNYLGNREIEDMDYVMIEEERKMLMMRRRRKM